MSVRISRRGMLSRLGLAAGAVGVSGGVVAQASAARTIGRSLPRVIHGTDWRVTWPGVKPGDGTSCRLRPPIAWQAD